jgi:hypothetical protein
VQAINNFADHPGSYIKSFLLGAAKASLASGLQNNFGITPSASLQPSNDIERAGAGMFGAIGEEAAVVLPLVGDIDSPGLRNTLEPGPYAGESVPASGPKITTSEQTEINRIGQDTGCHTCGATDPGTKSGNFVGDHQPPNALKHNGQQQNLYPQCLTCSRTQGGQVRAQQAQQTPPPRPPRKPTQEQ